MSMAIGIFAVLGILGILWVVENILAQLKLIRIELQGIRTNGIYKDIKDWMDK